MKSMNQLYKTDSGSGDSSSSSSSSSEQVTPTIDDPETRRINQAELPIKPKPLTIKKSSGAESPKLKSTNGPNIPVPSLQQTNNGNNKQPSNAHVGINRRIEIPPAFHFPELTTSDLRANQNNNLMNRNEEDDFGSKLVAPPNIVITDIQEPKQTETEPISRTNNEDVIGGNDMNGNSVTGDRSVDNELTTLPTEDGQIIGKCILMKVQIFTLFLIVCFSHKSMTRCLPCQL